LTGDSLGLAKIRETEGEDRHTRVAAEGPWNGAISKRGKIPQQDWPSIMARYEAGETLANIGRTYDCSLQRLVTLLAAPRERGGCDAERFGAARTALVKSHTTELFPGQPQRGEAITK